MLACGIGRKAPGREGAVGVDNPERSQAQFAPDERIETGIAVAVWMAVVDRQRQIAVHCKRAFRIRSGTPRGGHAYFFTGFGKPPAIVLDCQRHAVKDRRKTVVEKSVDGTFGG